MKVTENLVLTSLNHNKLINDAFEMITFDDNEKEQNIKIQTFNRSIDIQRKTLLIGSSFIRSLLSSLPSSTEPVLIIPDCDVGNIELIRDLLASGEVVLKQKKGTTSLVADAKLLGIELSNLDIVNEIELGEQVTKHKINKKRNVQEQIDTFLSKSISNLLNQCTVCLK